MSGLKQLSILLLLSIVLLTGLGLAETQKKPIGRLTVTVNAVCKGTFADSDEFYRGQDNLTVNYQGAATYQVLGFYDDNSSRLELESFQQTISGGGNGSIHSQDGFSESWTYKIINSALEYSVFSTDVLPVSGQVVINFSGFIYPHTVVSTSGEYRPAYCAAHGVAESIIGLEFKRKLMGNFHPEDKHWTTSGTINHRQDYGDMMQGTFTANFSATFSPVPQPSEQLEAVVIPDSKYINWIPEAGKDSETPGNTLTFKAKLRVKGKPQETPSENARFKFEMIDVSKEPGICLNYPLQNPSDGADLRFDPHDNSHLTVWEGGQVAVDKEFGQESEVTISSYDWGAYGILKVTAVTESGKTVTSYIQGQPGKAQIEIPYDKNNNKIADAWERAQAVPPVNSSGDWDGEPQKGNSHTGDGFTLYEEYRGVMSQGRHRYLNPQAKDLIVENPHGDLIRPGLVLFESAAGIRVIELKAGELAKDRRVNMNHRTYHRGDQYGLRIQAVKFTRPGSEDLEDEYTLAAALPDRMHRSPKDCEKIGIRQGYVQAYFDKTVLSVSKNQIRAALTLAVAHEMAHALSVQHHGDYTAPYNVTLNPGSPATAYDEFGKELAKPLTIGDSVGAAMGPASGDARCIMSYIHSYEWCYNPRENSFRRVPKQPDGSIFCTHGKGTGINANNNYFGDAAPGRGNCLGKMRVKDYE